MQTRRHRQAKAIRLTVPDARALRDSIVAVIAARSQDATAVTIAPQPA